MERGIETLNLQALGKRFFVGKRMNSNDPLNDPSTAFEALDEKHYMAEVKLVDQYQSFTAEILRLSLLGIAVFGFLYKLMFQDLDPANPLPNFGLAKTLAAILTVTCIFSSDRIRRLTASFSLLVQ